MFDSSQVIINNGLKRSVALLMFPLQHGRRVDVCMRVLVQA